MKGKGKKQIKKKLEVIEELEIIKMTKQEEREMRYDGASEEDIKKTKQLYNKKPRKVGHRLSAGCQHKLEEFYKKWKKKCIFGKYPRCRINLAYDEIIYRSMEYMDAILPTRIKNEELALKRFEKRWKKYKKTKKYKEGMKWMRNRKRMELPLNRRK